jgi:hypothetical protein
MDFEVLDLMPRVGELRIPEELRVFSEGLAATHGVRGGGMEEDEWKVLWSAVKQKPPPALPPGLLEAIRMIGALGGFIPSKKLPDSGTISLYRGLLRLEAMAEGYRLARMNLTDHAPPNNRLPPQPRPLTVRSYVWEGVSALPGDVLLVIVIQLVL